MFNELKQILIFVLCENAAGLNPNMTLSHHYQKPIRTFLKSILLTITLFGVP